MEAPESSCPALSASDQPAPAPGPPGPPAGQASPHLTLSPVILPPEQGLPSAVLLKALPIPLYHTVPPGGLQPRAPLVTGSLDGGGVPFILSPLLQPEGPGPAQAGKPAAPTLTVNIVGALPVLSPGLGPTLGSPGKARSAGRHLCPHCGRDCLKPSVLEKHIRSHTGERPFPCATCHIAFKTQSNLYKHRRTQTHLNNSRLSLESEGGGSSLLEDGDRVGEPSPADGSGESRNQGASETPLSPDAPLSLVAQNQGGKMEVAPCPRSTPAHTEASLDSSQMVSPGPLLASTQPRRKLPADLKSCSLPRQQEAASEKPWDPKAPEGRLRKCESTDSGYLSRSDSAEQPPLPSSPLRSLSEHSAESEGEGGLGPGPRSARAEPGAPGELEKRRLEERIARLISHNQAVVDDPQLDHVRPRKTVLSKQGSIDLPTPYTYKDSFHFDIRAREPGRRRAALSPAHSTLTPLDRLRPLFFHSVPTQLSTTVECVPLTRSNSLPFVEGSRTWPEPRALKDACPRTQKALSPRPTPARLGCRSGLTLADVPSGHPRALVRQAAVEDLPCALAGDTSVPTEDLGEKRTVTADGASGKGRVPSKKCGQRKLKMFSQEKWQVYGHETFRRLYQKVRTSHQGGHKAREVRTSHGKDLALPSQEEAEGGKSTAPCQDSRTPVLGDISVEAKPGSWGSLPAPKGSLETEPLKQTKTEARTGDSDPSRPARAASSPTLSSRESPQSESRNPLLPPNEGLDTGWQLPPASGPLQGADPGVPSLALPAPQVGGGMPGGGGMKETGPWAQVVLRRPSGGSGEPWPAEDKHPSERKKLKVDERDPQEQPGALGAETPGDPVKASSLPCQKQDGDPGEMPGGSAQQDSKALESSDASPTAPAAAPSWAGLGDKEPIPLAADGDRGQHSQLAAPPQAPGVLAALAEGAFPPKYLLRVPQGKTPSALLATQRPPQGQDSLCTTRWPEERASLVGPGLGTPWSLSPVSGPTSGGADGILEHPSWSRPRDGGQEAHEGSEKGDGTDSRVPAAREYPGSTAGPPWELTSFPTTPTCATMAQVAGGEVHAIRHFCTGSTLAGARTSEGVLDLRTPSGELGGPPKEAPEGLPSEPPAVRDPCCSWQPSSFLRALIRPQGMSLGQPEQALSLHLGTPRSCGAQSPFPSLRAEPRLTWCCLSRSLPLPVEQEKASSVYQAPRCLGGSLQDARPNALPVSNGGRTRRSPGGGELVQTPQLSHPMVPGRRSQDQPSDPEWKKGLFRRRVKTSRGNSKQRRLKINPKRYEGTFWQSRTPLRTSRLRKPLWVPRSCPRLRLEGPEPHGTRRNSGLNLQGDSSCATSVLSLGCGNEEEKEGDCGRISEISSPSSSSRTTRERDKSTAKDISPSAGQDGGCSQQHDAAAVPGLPLQVDTCVAVAKDDPTPQGKGLEAGLPEAQLPPSQGQVAGDPKPCVSSDAQEPPSFGSKGTFPHHDIATSVAAICISVGASVGHTMLGIHSAEPQEHSWAAGEALAQSSPAGRAKLTSGQKTVGSAPRGSTGEVHLETPAPGLSSTRPHKEEGGHQAVFPSRGHYGCGEMAIPCPKAGSDSEKCQVSELITWKGCVVSSNPGQPSEVPEAPSRSVRKRSLEGMRKQTRVELSDSSSDDEDRLVIEI